MRVRRSSEKGRGGRYKEEEEEEEEEDVCALLCSLDVKITGALRSWERMGRGNDEDASVGVA
jgi:hypothetical protein